jgi:hypothetical protein
MQTENCKYPSNALRVYVLLCELEYSYLTNAINRAGTHSRPSHPPYVQPDGKAYATALT